jgi:hypothetical protein
MDARMMHSLVCVSISVAESCNAWRAQGVITESLLRHLATLRS